MTLTVGSLFSGIGGIDLGLERAGMKVRWQVEIDPWCTRVLAKHWPDVERFADVREVGSHNLAPVDVIAGGFPCQPVSFAGKGLAQDDPRWLWPEFARVIRELRPRYALMENVPGLLARGFGDVLRDLAESGYDAEWDCIPAAAVGAPHRRDRVWVVAYPARERDGSGAWLPQGRNEPVPTGRSAAGRETALADSDNGGRLDGQAGELAAEARLDALREPFAGGPDVADAYGIAAGTGRPQRSEAWEETRMGGTELPNTEINGRRPRRARRPASSRQRERESVWALPDADGQPLGRLAVARCERGHWATEPNVGRVAHGIPQRVDRLRGLGNAVVPQVVEWIGWRIVEAEQAA